MLVTDLNGLAVSNINLMSSTTVAVIILAVQKVLERKTDYNAKHEANHV